MKFIRRFITALFFVIILFPITHAQNVITYNLNGDLNPLEEGQPTLKVLGNGDFLNDTLAEIDSLERNAFQFDFNSGLYYDNNVTNFLGESYSIEMYFKFKNLSSWRRIIDYKNRTTDNGLYSKDSRINFYNITISTEAPIVANEYAHVIVTRDSTENSLYAVYVDGVLISSFEDYNQQGVLSGDNLLVFFRDDLIVPDEASEGSVSLIKLYDYPLSAGEVSTTYGNLKGTLTTAFDKEIAKHISRFRLAPNPATETVTLIPSTKRLHVVPEEINIQIVDVQGRTVKQSPFLNTIAISELHPGFYVLIIRNDQFVLETHKLIIK